MRFAIALFTKSLQPVLSQGLKIHEELAVQVKNQARELVRQVSINTTQEEFRKKCARMAGQSEKEACQLFERVFQGSMMESDLMRSVQILTFTSMLNVGILTGEPLN